MHKFYDGVERNPAKMPLPPNQPWSSHYALAKAATVTQPKRYLEIGAQAGLGASIVGKHTENSKCQLVLCDYPGGGYGGWDGSRQMLENNMNKWAAGRHQFIFGDSQTKELQSQIIANGPYDMAFIDGNHSYAGAQVDYYTVMQCLSPTGTIIFDDINHGAHKDLYDLWKWVKEQNKGKAKHFEESLQDNGYALLSFGDYDWKNYPVLQAN
jgi:predicted O-methyltransferase YrrM